MYRVVTMVDQIGVFGGGEKLAREVAVRLEEARFRSTFCVTRWDPAYAEREDEGRLLAEIEASGTRFLGIERGGPLALAAWRPLIAYLRRERIDVLHAHKFGSNAWAVLIGRLGGVAAIVTHEHTWSFDPGAPGARLRIFVDRNVIGRGADVCVAVSREDARRMHEVEGIPREKIRLIPNGVALTDASPGGDVRAELGIGSGQPVIGTAMTLHRYKAVDNLIRAAAVLAADHPDLRVLVAGPRSDIHPEHEDELRDLIGELGLERNVLMLGLRTDVADVIAAMDVAVCPSDQEGSPLAIIEYMERCKPVVGTAVGGVPDMIREGETGYVVPPREPEALAAAVGRLLADRALAERLGAEGRRWREEEFDVSTTARRCEQLYLELLDGGPPRSA